MINTRCSFCHLVKYFYCPKCKHLRVKSWMDIRYRCEMCYGDVVAIDIPLNWAIVLMYALYFLSPAFALAYFFEGNPIWIYVSIALFGLLVVAALIAFSKGERYAKAKIRITDADVAKFRKRGWL